MTVITERPTDVAAELRDVNKWYGHHHVLTDVSLSIGRGEIVALIGRSGSGKSTVLRVLAGLSKDHTGETTVAGSPALAFQEPRLFPWRDVRTNVVYGLNRSKLGQQEARARADAALADVGLADRANSVAVDPVGRSGPTGFACTRVGRRTRAAPPRRAVRSP